MAIAGTFTLWKYADKEAKLTYNVTVRPGWTPDMLQESRHHYVEACQAARDGKRLIVAASDPIFSRNEYSPCTHDEARVQIFGDVAVQVAPGIRQTVTINCFTETQTGQDLLDELWTLVDALQMIEAVTVVEKAQPPQPATLRPSITTQDELNAYAEQHPYDDVTDMPNIKIRPSRQRVTDDFDSIAGDDN